MEKRMHTRHGVAALALAALISVPATAQDPEQRNREIPTDRGAGTNCDGMMGAQLNACRAAAKKPKESSGAPGITAKDGKHFNDTATAASAKQQARDFAGAAAIYRSAIEAAPKSSALHRLYAGLAITLRQQGVTAYNNGPQGTDPGPGATNDQIRAANAANAAARVQRTNAALPLFKQAQEAAVKAAELAAASQDRGADPNIATELRQDAVLLYQLDHDNVLRTPRPSAELEAQSFRKWLADNPSLPQADVAQAGIATAATLVAKDPAAGLTLADEVLVRAANDQDATLGYADLVVAAKLPAGDPRRAKALAGITRIESALTDPAKQAKAQDYKKALSGA